MNYKKIYDDLVSKAKLEDRKKYQGVYYENHHIIPTCMGGSNLKENKVFLTAKEHFIVHKLLVEIHPKEKGLIYALHRMMFSKFEGRDYIISSREYEIFRILFSKTVSENMTGVKKSLESVQKLIEKLKLHVGWNHSEETIAKYKETWARKKEEGYDIGSHCRGKSKGEEFCKNQSLRMLGENNPSVKFGPWNEGISWSKEVCDKISTTHKVRRTFVDNKNPRYIPIDEEVFKNIVIDLECGYGGVIEISNYYNINSQRLFRHLYYNSIIFIEDLPKYLQKRIILNC